MAEENKDAVLTDEGAMERLLSEAQFVRQGRKVAVLIEGKTWHLRPTSNAQNEAMASLDFDVMFWQKQLKEAQSAKQAKKLNRLIRKAYAKKAAHKVLGLRLRWVPMLYGIM